MHYGARAGRFLFFFFWGSLAAAQEVPAPAPAPAPTLVLAELSRHKEAWPAQVTLKSALSLSIFLNGQAVGATVAAAGTVVDLVAVGEQELTVALHGAQASVAPDRTDLAERLAAAPAVSSAPAPASAPVSVPAPTAPAPASPPPSPPAAAPASGEPTPLQFDFEATPQGNYTKAAYHFWCPAYDRPVRAVLSLTPGFNGDGRGMAGDKAWQAFARKHDMAIVASFLQGPDYHNAKGGTGGALLEAVRDFAKQAGRPEIATVPLVLWGHSAGGQFDYNFVLWKPERVAAFVVNKGGYYDQDPPSAALCNVPGLFFLGEKDEGYRVKAITGIWTAGRKKGALWALAPEPNAHHEVSTTAEVARVFFDGVLPRRLPEGSGLQSLHEEDGWIGDLATHEIQAAPSPALRDASWLPDEAAATAWKGFVSVK